MVAPTNVIAAMHQGADRSQVGCKITASHSRLLFLLGLCWHGSHLIHRQHAQPPERCRHLGADPCSMDTDRGWWRWYGMTAVPARPPQHNGFAF